MMQGPPGPPSNDTVPLREYFERLLQERDRLYENRAHASETALRAALTAQKEGTAAAFASSQTAVLKSEEAQKEYNIRSNEFRGQLDDQAKLLMQRTEAIALFKADNDKMDTLRSFMDARAEAQRISMEKMYESLSKEISSLREYRSESTGQRSSIKDAWGYIIAGAGIGLALLSRFVPLK